MRCCLSKISYLVIGLSIVLVTQCTKFDEYNPPAGISDSNYSIGMGNAYTAWINFELTAEPVDHQKLFLRRTRLTNNNVVEKELEMHSIGSGWTVYDTVLVPGHDYKYELWGHNSDGYGDSISIKNYLHNFKTPKFEIHQTAYNSIRVLITNIDALADSVILETALVKRLAISTLNDTVDIIIKNCTPNLADHIDARYHYLWYNDSYVSSNDTLQYPFKTIIPAVLQLLLVDFNKDYSRVTWSYPGNDTIGVTEFVVNGISYDHNYSQGINGHTMYCLYLAKTNSVTNTPYCSSVAGLAQDVTASITSSPEDYTFIDSGLYGNGFYLCNHEMTNAEFYAIYKDHTSFPEDTTWLKNTDFAFTVNTVTLATDRGDYPVRGVPYSVVNRLFIEIPTMDEWEMAASASSGDQRLYPWGNEPPQASYCNYASAEPDTMQSAQGAVMVNTDALKYGPYNMSGNVAEWTTNGSDAVAKGGSYISTLVNDLKISSKAYYRKDYSYPHVGIRQIVRK